MDAVDGSVGRRTPSDALAVPVMPIDQRRTPPGPSLLPPAGLEQPSDASRKWNDALLKMGVCSRAAGQASPTMGDSVRW